MEVNFVLPICFRSGSRPGTSATAAGASSSGVVAGGGSGGVGVGSEDFEMQGGYAFSQEEGGAVSQTEYIRRYDTTKTSPRGSRPKSGTDSIGGT